MGAGREIGMGTMWSLRMTLMPREQSVEMKINSALITVTGSNLPEAGPY